MKKAWQDRLLASAHYTMQGSKIDSFHVTLSRALYILWLSHFRGATNLLWLSELCNSDATYAQLMPTRLDTMSRVADSISVPRSTRTEFFHYFQYGSTLSLYSISRWTSYRKILWSPKAARLGFRPFKWLWCLTGSLATALLSCLSNFRVLWLL